MMKKKTIALLLSFVLCFCMTGTVFAEDQEIVIDDILHPFLDVDADAWYFDAVWYVKNEGLMTGKSGAHAGYFAPGEYLQRHDLAVIFGRYYKNAVNSELNLDESKNAYYEDAVNWVKKYQIMNGYSSGDFGVGDTIIRQDFAVALYNFAQSVVGYVSIPERDPGVLGKFPDADEVSDYANMAMYWMVRDGIIQGEGTDVKMLNPQGPVNRAMAATMLQRFIEVYGADFEKYGNKTLL